MTKLVQINTVCNGSTGNIMCAIQKESMIQGFDTISYFGRRKPNRALRSKKFGSFSSFWYHVFITTVFDKHGYGSYFQTKRMVKCLRKENPDIIHLHNIHGYYINLKVLFKYLNEEYKGKIFWTFHDFWPITGHCPHFIAANCDKWKTGCYKCPNKKFYPISLFFDNSKKNYLLKKQLFGFRNDITIICPSSWGKKIVEKSFLGRNKIEVINNGIDLKQFHKVNYEELDIELKIYNKKVILGVANIWDERKGLNEFINISKLIGTEYIIILVGLSKNQIGNLLKYENIIAYPRVDKEKLILLYSRADVFINPSIEETFSLVCIEALACETPIIVHKNTPMEEFVNEKNGVTYSGHITINDIEKALSIKEYDFSNIKKYDNKVMCKNIINLYNN